MQQNRGIRLSEMIEQLHGLYGLLTALFFQCRIVCLTDLAWDNSAPADKVASDTNTYMTYQISFQYYNIPINIQDRKARSSGILVAALLCDIIVSDV